METLFYYTGAAVWVAIFFGVGGALAVFSILAAEAAVMTRRSQRALRAENAPKENSFRMWWHFFCDPCDVFYTHQAEVRWPTFGRRTEERFGRALYRIYPKSDA